MKKKLLLIALPALMVLSGCANVQKEQPKAEEQPAIQFEEDTVAHEEIFGEAVEAKQPAIRKMDVVDTKDAYKVGYQIHFEDKGDADASNDVISIRFIAAINATYSSMVWSRGIATGVGTETRAFGNKRTNDTFLQSTVVYTSLCNGAGNDVMEAENGDYADYTGFIVYSMRNIPYEENKDSYVGVSLLMDAVQTDFYAVKIKKNAGGTASSDAFSFSKNKSGFFLAGTISGRTRTVNSDSSFKGDNAAAFDTDFVDGDNFLVIQKESNLFKLWDSRCITSDPTNGTSRFFADSDGRISVTSGGDIRLFLNGSDQLWSDTYSPYTRNSIGEHGGLFIRGSAVTNTDNWDCKPGYELKSDRKDYAVLFHVYLYAGEFKIANSDWEGEQYNYITGGDKTDNFEDGGGGNARCLTAGYYDIYLNNDNPRGVYIFKSE